MRTSYLLDALNAVNALNAAKTNTWDWKAGEASPYGIRTPSLGYQWHYDKNGGIVPNKPKPEGWEFNWGLPTNSMPQQIVDGGNQNLSTDDGFVRHMSPDWMKKRQEMFRNWFQQGNPNSLLQALLRSMEGTRKYM